VAEQLGEAVLKITVDDTEALRKLGELKAELTTVQRSSAQLGGRATAGSPTSSGTRSLNAQTQRAIDFENRLARARERNAKAAEKSAIAETKARQKDLQGRISSGLIGGAFPLLFGQGPAAALGGLAGGVAGGGAFGFGLSLVGTGIGSSFDTLIARSKELAEALRDPIAAFDQLKTTAALSSRGLETYIDALIKSGQVAKAEQLIRDDLTQNINPTTAAALSQANDDLARSYSDIQEKLTGILAGPAISFLQWLDDILDRLPVQGPGGTTPGQLPSAAAAQNLSAQGRTTQGIGLGLGASALATILLGAGLTASGVGAPAGLAALTYGLTAASAGTVALGRGQEAQGNQATVDINTQQRTATIQKELESIQARRVALQKQLISFTGNESSAAAQLAQTQNVVLAAQEAIVTAKQTFLSLPPDSSADENKAAYDGLKKSIEAARLEVEKLAAANNNQAESLKRTTDLRESTTGFTPAARKETELIDELNRARNAYNQAKDAAATADEAGRAAAEADVNKFGQLWRAASQSLKEYNAEQQLTAQRQKEINADTLAGLRQSISNAEALSATAPGASRERRAIELASEQAITEAKREQVRLQNELNRLSATGTQTEIDNAAALVEQAKARADLASSEGGLRLQEIDDRELENLKQKNQAAAETAASRVANELRETATRLIEAAQVIKAAAQTLRSAQEGALAFLAPGARQALVAQARADLSKQTGIGGGAIAGAFLSIQSQLATTVSQQRQLLGGGLFNKLPSNVSDEEVIAAANAARSVTSAQEAYAKASQSLTDATIALAEKDWRVNVQILGSEGTVYGDAINEALSGLPA
jgi:hypothetical protein